MIFDDLSDVRGVGKEVLSSLFKKMAGYAKSDENSSRKPLGLKVATTLGSNLCSNAFSTVIQNKVKNVISLPSKMLRHPQHQSFSIHMSYSTAAPRTVCKNEVQGALNTKTKKHVQVDSYQNIAAKFGQDYEFFLPPAIPRSQSRFYETARSNQRDESIPLVFLFFNAQPLSVLARSAFIHGVTRSHQFLNFFAYAVDVCTY